MRQLYMYDANDANDANESTRQLVAVGISMGLVNVHTAHGFSVLYHMFAQKQYILCSESAHKSYLTLLYVASIQDSSALELLRMALLQPRIFARL